MACLQSQSYMTMTREGEGVGPFGNPSPSAQISSQKKSVTELGGDMMRRPPNSLERRYKTD